jgi:hypothetical protein
LKHHGFATSCFVAVAVPVMMFTHAAGKEISEEEGNNRLAPSSIMLQLGLRVSDVINFRLETVIMTSWMFLATAHCL